MYLRRRRCRRRRHRRLKASSSPLSTTIYTTMSPQPINDEDDNNMNTTADDNDADADADGSSTRNEPILEEAFTLPPASALANSPSRPSQVLQPQLPQFTADTPTRNAAANASSFGESYDILTGALSPTAIVHPNPTQHNTTTMGHQAVTELGNAMQSGFSDTRTYIGTKFNVLNNNVRCYGGRIEGSLVRQRRSNLGHRSLTMNQAADAAPMREVSSATLSPFHVIY